MPIQKTKIHIKVEGEKHWVVNIITSHTLIIQE